MEKQAKLFLALSLIGILLLLLLASCLSPEEMKISEINGGKINQNVKILGTITNVKAFSDSEFQLLTLEDETGRITVTAFSEEKLNLTNKQVIVTGKVSEYNKELQINAEEIKLN